MYLISVVAGNIAVLKTTCFKFEMVDFIPILMKHVYRLR